MNTMQKTSSCGVQAVLFDLDGTLIDSAPDLGAAAEKMRLTRGLPPLGLEAYRAMAGAGARGLLEVAFGMTPLHPDYQAYREEFLSNYAAAMTVHTQAFAGVADMLNGLTMHGLTWGIVTNKLERFALPLVSQMPLLASAAVVIGGDTTAYPKPHPAPVLEAAKRLNVSPHVCWYVGDDHRDIQAGQAAGMTTVAARYGYLGKTADCSAWGADFFIDEPIQLLKSLGLP
jgi:N-acetyl-D-muramate 6-phosphate phosphatase